MEWLSILFSVIALSVATVSVLIIIGNNAARARSAKQNLQTFTEDLKTAVEMVKQDQARVHAKLDEITKQLEGIARRKDVN